MKCTCHCQCQREALAEENRTCRTCEFLDHKTFFRDASLYQSREAKKQRQEQIRREIWQKQLENQQEQFKLQVEHERIKHQIASSKAAFLLLNTFGAGAYTEPANERVSGEVQPTIRDRGCETVYIGKIKSCGRHGLLCEGIEKV